MSALPILAEAARPIGHGILPAGKWVTFTGRGTRRNSLAHDQLIIGMLYIVASCKYDLGAVRIRLKNHPGRTFLRSMFDVVS